MQHISFQSADGILLSGVWHLPVMPNGKSVLMVHGITADKDEKGIYIDTAGVLCDAGFSVFRFDFRGHGASGGRQVDTTISGELLDMAAAYHQVKAMGFHDVGLLGASFGGAISVLFASKGKQRFNAVCLWNPCLNFDHCFIDPTLPWLRDHMLQMRKDIASQGWTPLGSRKFKLGRTLYEEMKSIQPYTKLNRINIPTIIIHGDSDNHVPYDDSVEYVDSFGGQSELITVVNGTHGFHDDSVKAHQVVTATLDFFRKNL